MGVCFAVVGVVTTGFGVFVLFALPFLSFGLVEGNFEGVESAVATGFGA